LTVRPVHGGDTPAAGLLRIDPDAAPTPAGSAEYVVRTDDGATVAIVQAADPALRPGASVIIGRGERATLAVR
jgi:outer membrane lipoprotein SlyB